MARTSPRWSCAGGPSLNGAETAQKPELLAAEHGDIDEGLGPGQYRKRCRAIPPLLRWLGCRVDRSTGGMITIDGKTSRRSGRKKDGNPAIHMVSAFAARQRIVLGQVKVAEKSTEIIAIPKLLDMLAIEGAIVTIETPRNLSRQ